MNTKRNISENQDFSRKDVLFRIEMFLSIAFTGSMVKNLPANAGDAGLIPGLGRSPGARNVNSFERRSVVLLLHGLPRWLNGKESACQCRRHRDAGSIPGLGRSPG